jgi:hypothetical protein
MVSKILSSRSEFYAEPSLGPWAGHGGDRINKKIQQILKKAEGAIAGAGGVVDEEMIKVKGKKGTSTPTPTPTKKGGKINQASALTPTKKGGKKRKVECEEEEEEAKEE